MFFDLFKKTPLMAGCGHPVKNISRAMVLGKKEKIKWLDKSKIPEHCPECFARMAIRCVKCGRAIFPDDPITLYDPEEVGKKYLDSATVFNDKNHNSVIGCVSSGCAEFAQCVGYWVEPGKVRLLSIAALTSDTLVLS